MRLPLSEAQLGVWHALRIDPAGSAYDLGGYADLRGPLDPGLLEQAGTAMVAEVEAFRVRIDDTTDPVTQVIAPPAALPLARRDFAGRAEALAWMRADLATPRDPSRDPTLEISLLRLGPERHFWYVRSHHVILDGYSVPLVCSRVAEIYTALVRGVTPGPSPFAPYRLLLDAETAYRASPEFGEDRRFWLDRMAGAHDIPTLGVRTGAQLGPFHHVSAELTAEVADALRARGPGRAWVPALMAAFAGYLGRLTGATELRLGVPMACRSGPLLRVPGNAANLLPLRVAVPPGHSADELTAAVAAELRQVRRHQRYRGEELAREMGAVGIGPALFGPSVNIRDFDHGLAFGECQTTLDDLNTGPVEDLTLSVRRQDGRFQLGLAGNAGAYTRPEIEAHLPRFVDYLRRFTKGSLSSEPANQAGRRRHGPVSGSGTLDLAAAFVAQCGRTGEVVALRDQARSWTFAALGERVDRLAGALRRAGVGPETLVALALPRSAEYVIAMLAVARAGGAWLPLDLTHPPGRTAETLRVSPPALALVTEVSAPPPLPAEIPLLSVTAAADSPVPAVPRPDNLAYVVQTSGSTGRPRAVAVTRGAVANLLASHRAGIQTRVPEGVRLRVGHTAPFTVDAAVDPLLWMVAGHELVLVRNYQDPDALLAERLDLVDVPPSYLRVLLDAGLADSHLVFGGEAVSPELWDRLRAMPPDRLRLNAYGPTEFTVDALQAEVGVAEEPVLGEPVAGCRALVLDGALRPVPEGGVGELYLGGPGLARGYAGQPGLTASRFVADPHGPPGERLFRTGDLVRIRFDGHLTYRGRADDQVKIRGFRVEPREVEAVLASHPDVLSCAVVPRPGPGGGPMLVGYVVTRLPGREEAVLVHAREKLPDHLVPARIVPLPKLPFAADGTLDRRALPDPGPLGDRPYREPATPIETTLCASFASVLGIEKVGVDDDFFALGGDSLLAGRLQADLRARVGVKLALRTIFTHRTVQALARALT